MSLLLTGCCPTCASTRKGVRKSEPGRGLGHNAHLQGPSVLLALCGYVCANKVTTTYHLIGTAVRGYVAQSTGRIGLSNKNNSESHCQGEQELQLGF
jgi:hypothetical protein